jgi:hypothetical protein
VLTVLMVRPTDTDKRTNWKRDMACLASQKFLFIFSTFHFFGRYVLMIVHPLLATVWHFDYYFAALVTCLLDHL